MDATLTNPTRCLGCGYVLIGLPAGRCPECGRPFDPADVLTYSTKPLFVRWKFWLPGFLLACAGGSLIYLLILAIAGWGAAVTLVAPFCLGAIVGYGCRARPFVLVLLALGAAGVVVFTLATLSIVGVFCGTALAAVALTPILFGTLCGFLLRLRLKSSEFEQRWYLPALLLLIAPVLWAVVERLTGQPHAVESVATSMEISEPVGRVWNTLIFYEEVRARPPWLLRYGLPRPLYTRGSTGRLGDRKTCFYSKGHLTKRVTSRVTNRTLAFDVVEQDRIEMRSVRLTGGSFALKPDGPQHTHVQLTTSYQPKLGPRWVWRPFERLAVHTLHQHVLAGMREQAVEGATDPDAQKESR